jgi:hypothetical protein
MTYTVLTIAQTRTKIPAPKTREEAIFSKRRRLDPQSRGRGIMIRYMSVETLAAKVDHTTGRDTAAWQTSIKVKVSRGQRNAHGWKK